MLLSTILQQSLVPTAAWRKCENVVDGSFSRAILNTCRSDASFRKWSYLKDCLERGSKNLPPPMSLCSVTNEGILVLGSLTGVSWSLLYKAKAPATPSFKRESLFNRTRTSNRHQTGKSLNQVTFKHTTIMKRFTCKHFIEFTRWGVPDEIWSYTDLGVDQRKLVKYQPTLGISK